jgi:hypothetical protein
MPLELGQRLACSKCCSLQSRIESTDHCGLQALLDRSIERRIQQLNRDHVHRSADADSDEIIDRGLDRAFEQPLESLRDITGVEGKPWRRGWMDRHGVLPWWLVLADDLELDLQGRIRAARRERFGKE